MSYHLRGREEVIILPHVGEFIRDWRDQAGLSLRGLSEKSGFSPTYIERIEKNKPHPSTGTLPRPPIETIVRLAEACGVPGSTAKRVMFDIEGDAPASREAQEFDLLTRPLNPAQRQGLMRALRSMVETMATTAS